jgi:hypothetical protein
MRKSNMTLDQFQDQFQTVGPLTLKPLVHYTIEYRDKNDEYEVFKCRAEDSSDAIEQLYDVMLGNVSILNSVYITGLEN